ncbi:glycine zipper family protein [Aliiroseovarius sp.]|uniref:glycine zipper family protein n=1 Tax=Aliiroseovarius sp. TaxID=1872442 RepID=UPI003BA9255E
MIVMKTGKPVLLIGLILTAAACAKAPVDRPLTLDGPQAIGFQDDLATCRSLALGYDDPELNKEIAGTAAVGAVIGGLDADDGDELEGALIGAAVGGLVGAAEKNEAIKEEQREVLIRCMQGRGHRVIG